MALTPRGIPYPDDYTAPADVPAALSSLAEAADDAIDTVDAKAVAATATAQTAQNEATSAVAAVASHTHSGAGSVAIPLTSVTGLNAALADKSDTSHNHDFVYATANHQHDAQEIGAHTHVEYAPTTHDHTQAQSHNSADTNASASAIHHTLGTSANQAAAGNHTHSGFAPTTHTHTTYAATTHSHSAYSATGHTHSAADVQSGTLPIGRIPTGTTSTTVAVGNHTHSATSITSGTLGVNRIPIGTSSKTVAAGNHTHTALDSLTLTSLQVSNATLLKGANSDTSTSAPNLRINTNTGEIKRTTYSVSSQQFKHDIIPLTDTNLSDSVDDRLLSANPFPLADYADLLTVTPVQYRRNADPSRVCVGFIAEDVRDKFPYAAAYDDDGNLETIDDRALLAGLFAVVQQQQRRIEDLEARLS